MRIPCPDSVTIHGGAMKIGQRMRSTNIPGQDATQGGGNLYFLRLNCRPGKMREEECAGLIRRKEGEEFGHGISEARMSG